MRVCWMYHDIMDLYGDKGNMLVLSKRCKDRGIPFELDTCGIGEEKDLSSYDLLFFGGGADKEQLSLIPDLLSRKENIAKAIDEKTFVLLICGGYQMFGKYYVAADGSKIECLGFYDYRTETGAEGSRCIGNIVIEAQLDDLHTKWWVLKTMAGRLSGWITRWGRCFTDAATALMQAGKAFMTGRSWERIFMDLFCRKTRRSLIL